MSKKQAGKALEAKIATVVAVTIILHTADLGQADQQLAQLTGGQQDYFDHELAVIELALDEAGIASIDWAGLLALLRRWNLNPVAVRHAPSALQPALHQLGLSLDEVGSRTPVPDAEPAQTAPAPARPAPAFASVPASAAASSPAPSRPACMIVDTPVRGGQRIYARDADLVVTAAVNAGAELIADGSIHVYAPLRGRALAGASGNAGARIFALSMEAELVSIAGIYRTFEDGQQKEMARKPAEVRLEGDRLEMRPISSERST
ncbi:septum site-determining protein MinC [Lacisediminimonas profundi]|uniref:septum site-determining protein MinC n=1 Tax=Lacisediminimonas profundi TaxID=2603856 RepID=UPI00124B62D7|nr:septum site-determining protein MinC [Lacisediminimonas profundi]